MCTLDTCLRLLHPFTPYITEELWGHLKRAAQAHSPALAPQGGWEEALIVAHWPTEQPEAQSEVQAVADFSLVMDVVRAIRNARAEKKVTPGKRIPATLAGGERAEMLRRQLTVLSTLAHLDAPAVQILEGLPEKPQGGASLVVSGVEIFLPLADLVDAGAERARLEKELDEVKSQIARLEELLASPFAQRAPAAVVEKERQKLATFQETAAKLKGQIEG